jgi:Rho-associated protein kinase 2
MENVEKLKKINTELSVSKSASESALSDLNDKNAALAEDRNLLEREMAKLQSQLQLEKNQRNETSVHVHDVEGRLKALTAELDSARAREQSTARQNAELNGELAEKEKARAQLDLEFKSLHVRYEQLVNNANEARRDVTDDLLNNAASRQDAERLKALEDMLAEEKQSRSRAESSVQDKDREISMLSVDYRQLQYRADKLEADLRQETEKGRNLYSQLERLREEKSLMQSDLSVQVSEITLLRTNEKRLMREATEYRERAKSLEEELHKVKAARSVDDLQRKELEEQLEAEQYFSTLYKTQVRELQAELDEGKDRSCDLEREREGLGFQLQQAHLRADNEARARRVAEEDIAELEKEKMMIELELKEMNSKFKSDARNLEMQLVGMKDTEGDLLQKIDLLSKDNNELQYKVKELQDELDLVSNNPPPAPVQLSPIQDVQFELDKMKKMLSNERLLKQQAVNKLAEIMNRKDFNKKDRRAESKATSAELRKKEKENRRLQQELTMEKEKFNQMVGKYTKDLQDLQATLYEESQSRLKLSMELDTKESDLETLQNKLAHMNLDTASLSSGTGDFGDPGLDGALMAGEHSLEGWLQIPSRQNIRRHGWKKLYVIVSSKKIIFFNSEVERQNADPMLIIDLK